MASSDRAAAPPSTAITIRVEKALSALLKWRESQLSNLNPQLLPQDDFVYLSLSLKKIPSKSRTNPFKIPLPHPLLDSSSELCLIIDDRAKSNLTKDVARKIIKSQDISISKVLSLSKLKTNYKSFESRRKLCDSYNLFFADDRIIPMMPKLLGKHFFGKKKLPLPVDLTRKNWKGQIGRACSSALLFMKTGTCSVVKVGKVSMETGEIVENVVAAIDGIVEVVSKNWVGVRSLHLKLSDSLSLPVYQALPDIKLKIQGMKEIEQAIKEDHGGELVVLKNDCDNEELRKKQRNRKGRIHEVRYMDAHAGVYDLLAKSDDDGDESPNPRDANDEMCNTNLERKVLSSSSGKERGVEKKEIRKRRKDGKKVVKNSDLGVVKLKNGKTKVKESKMTC